MTVFIEGDLEFNFGWAASAINFDDDALHAGHSMKRVDFIAEKADRYVLIEVKDPDHPKASPDRENFRRRFLSGELIPDLAAKYRDSLIFHALCDIEEKTLDYIVLLSMSDLDPALMLNKQDELHKAIPISHDKWMGDMANSCVILNLAQYKKKFGDGSVRRMSEGG